MKAVSRIIGRLAMKKRSQRPPLPLTYAKSVPEKENVPSRVVDLPFGRSHLDVELYPSLELIRVTGVDTEAYCLDFLIAVCNNLDLNPSQYALLMLGQQEFAWRAVQPSSKLDVIIHPIGTGPPKLRLANKSYINLVLKSNLCTFRKRSAYRESQNTTPLSGREMLEQLGTRIIINLPNQVKTVVRAQLDRPINEAVLKLCKERNLHPTDYRVYDPQTGNAVDPMKSFNQLNLTGVELKVCAAGESNIQSSAETANLPKAPDGNNFPPPSKSSTLPTLSSHTASKLTSQVQYRSTASGINKTSGAPRYHKKRLAPPIPRSENEDSYSVATMPVQLSDESPTRLGHTVMERRRAYSSERDATSRFYSTHHSLEYQYSFSECNPTAGDSKDDQASIPESPNVSIECEEAARIPAAGNSNLGLSTQSDFHANLYAAITARFSEPAEQVLAHSARSSEFATPFSSPVDVNEDGYGSTVEVIGPDQSSSSSRPHSPLQPTGILSPNQSNVQNSDTEQRFVRERVLPPLSSIYFPAAYVPPFQRNTSGSAQS